MSSRLIHHRFGPRTLPSGPLWFTSDDTDGESSREAFDFSGWFIEIYSVDTHGYQWVQRQCV